MNTIGTEIECSGENCNNRIIKRSPAHKYCDICKYKRRARSNQLYYEIKGSERRKRRRAQNKA